MSNVFITSLSGWIQIPLFCALVPLPYLLRGKPLRTAGRRARPFLERMRPHYWIGFAIGILTLLHAVVPMSSGLAQGTSATGLELATAALILVPIQLLLGVSLRNPRLPDRRLVRRWHFWVMAALAVLGLVHVWLNSALLQTLRL
jgi:hypothetical protein